MALAPESNELIFWSAVSMWTNGDTVGATPLFKRLFFRDRNWVNVLPRLVPAGLFPDAPAQIAAITALAPSERSWQLRRAPSTSRWSRVPSSVRSTRRGTHRHHATHGTRPHHTVSKIRTHTAPTSHAHATPTHHGTHDKGKKKR